MAKRYKTSRLVEFRDTDAAGIVHFASFFEWMEEVEHELLRHLGLSVLMSDQQGAISWPRVHASCDYRSTIRFEDVVDVEIWVGRIGTSSVTYCFQFSCAQRVVADAEVVAVCCRLVDGDVPKPMPIPEWITERLGDLSNE